MDDQSWEDKLVPMEVETGRSFGTWQVVGVGFLSALAGGVIGWKAKERQFETRLQQLEETKKK